MTAAAAQSIDQGLALLDERRVSGINPDRFRMGLQPFPPFLLAGIQQIGGEGNPLLFLEEEIGHAGVRTKRMRVRDPPHYPRWVGLGTDPSEIRADLLQLAIAFDQVTTVATHLYEEGFSLRNLLGLGQPLDVSVAFDTVRFHFGPTAQRMFPELHLSMGLFHAARGRSLPFVTRGAAKLFRRMGR